jgi:hypothetical protein
MLEPFISEIRVVAHDHLKLSGQRRNDVPQEFELTPDGTPVSVLILGSVDNLLGEESLSGLIEH